MPDATAADPAEARLFRRGRLAMGWCRARLARTLLVAEPVVAGWEDAAAAVPAPVLAWMALYARQVPGPAPCGCCGTAPALLADAPAVRPAPRLVHDCGEVRRAAAVPAPAVLPGAGKRRAATRRVRRHIRQVRRGAPVRVLAGRVRG